MRPSVRRRLDLLDEPRAWRPAARRRPEVLPETQNGGLLAILRLKIPSQNETKTRSVYTLQKVT